jgi:regulator of sigma E protease
MNTVLLTQLFQFIVGLIALILLHEFGHFIVARVMKVQIEEFGIGFPPRIVKLFEVGGTEFTLNWIPLGGFVRPKGENDPSVPGGLAASSPWVRLGVLLAGPGMNLLIGVLLGILLFYSLGDPILNKVNIQQVAAQSPAAEAGLQAGDLIVSVNGEPIDSTEKLQNLIEANLGKPTTLVYQRGNQNFTVVVTPRVSPPANQGAVGILLGHPTQPIGIGIAITRGAQAAYDYGRNVLLLPINIARGQVTPQEGRPVGFKGMFDIYQQIQSPIFFFMVISISLGIFNLFPIPALDGGRILLTLPEIIVRRRIPPQYENMIHLVGFTLLLILIIYINVQDFINPLQLPH